MIQKEKEQKICFDCDGTLIHIDDDSPRKEVIDLLKAFQGLGWKIYIHSGGGVQYAAMWARRLKLDGVTITPKGSPDYEFDIAVDDAIDSKVVEEQGILRYIKAKLFIKV